LTKTFVQKLVGIHPNESLQYLKYFPYVTLNLSNKSSINHLLGFSGFFVKGGTNRGLTQMLRTVCVGSRVGEAQMYSIFCGPQNKARIRCREAAFPKIFMSNNL
jgi:hypothetical protein